MADPDRTPPPTHSEPGATPLPEGTVSISSRELLQGAREVLIDHEGETYRLRLTRNGKLILHK